jgi:hypothetical protein
MVRLTPKDHVDRVERPDSFAHQLDRRCSKTISQVNPDDAIQTARKTVDSTPEGNPPLSERLVDLGDLLSKSFSRTQSLGNLDEAIQIGRRVLQLIAVDDSRWLKNLSILEFRIDKRYQLSGARIILIRR